MGKGGGRFEGARSAAPAEMGGELGEVEGDGGEINRKLARGEYVEL